MDRRTAFGTICSITASGGVTSIISATALPASSQYFDKLIIGGGVAIVLGALGLLGLMFTNRRKKTESTAIEFGPTAKRGKVTDSLFENYDKAIVDCGTDAQFTRNWFLRSKEGK